jgi:hypothetical protein
MVELRLEIGLSRGDSLELVGDLLHQQFESGQTNLEFNGLAVRQSVLEGDGPFVGSAPVSAA